MTGHVGRGRPRERGSAVVEITWLTILLLVPLVYLVLSVFEVQRAAYGVTAASRAAGRAFVLAPDQGSAYARAAHAAGLAMRDQGLSPAGGELAITCQPDPRVCLQPGSVVVVSVGFDVAVPLASPFFGERPPSIRVSSEHRSPYGTFREARP